MWPRTSLRVVLHAKHRVRLMPQPSQRLIIQIRMRPLNIIRQRIRSQLEVCVSRADPPLARPVVYDRMVPAMVAKLQLVGFAAERDSEDLMSQADSKDGFLPLQLFHILNRI